jgi:hypothetical protein
VGACPIDVCSPDACAVDVTPLPGIIPPGPSQLPTSFNGDGEEGVILLTGKDLEETFDLIDENIGD